MPGSHRIGSSRTRGCHVRSIPLAQPHISSSHPSSRAILPSSTHVKATASQGRRPPLSTLKLLTNLSVHSLSYEVPPFSSLRIFSILLPASDLVTRHPPSLHNRESVKVCFPHRRPSAGHLILLLPCCVAPSIRQPPSSQM